MPLAPALAHTDAVVAALQDADVLVGRGEQPAGSGWQGEPDNSVFTPYVVIYPTPGLADGNLADPHEYLDYTAQLNCVARRQEGAETVADIVKTALVGAALAIAGRASYPGQLTLDRPAARDDAMAPPVHYAVLQISWRTQPA